MPLSSEPPRPSDGVGRQAIRSTLPAANSRRVDRLTVARRRAARWLLVVVGGALLVDVANVVVGGWQAVDAVLVGLTVVSAAAVVVFLVASRSGGRR